MATLLPAGEQTFFSANGVPLAGGSVAMYIPSTTTPKDTWQDAGQTILNTNPITLDAAGRAIIYGAGSYRQIVFDSAGNTIWDQLTADTAVGGLAWGGTSTGTANAQVIAASSFSQQDGQQISFIVGAGLTNTGGTTVTPGAGGSPIAVLKDTVSGPTALTGGELVAGNIATLIYDQVRGAFHLVQNDGAVASGALTNLASASTTDLGTILTRNVNITGSVTITSFGSSASLQNPTYRLLFAAAPLLTYNASSLILPGAANIQAQAGDAAVALYLGSGNWEITEYMRAAVAPNTGAGIAGGFRQLVVTATGATTATIVASGLTLFNSAGNPYYASAVSLTNTNSGTGANGIDTGAIATSTWYFVYIIYNPTTNTVACLISLSATAPTMPSGYTYMLRVGALRNAASGGYWRTIQYGRRATIAIGTNPTTPPTIATGSAGSTSVPTWVAESISAFCPSTASAIAVIGVVGSIGSIIVAPNNSYGATASQTNPPPLSGNSNGGATTPQSASTWMTLESTNIYYASSASTNAIVTNGWEDNL